MCLAMLQDFVFTPENVNAFTRSEFIEQHGHTVERLWQYMTEGDGSWLVLLFALYLSLSTVQLGFVQSYARISTLLT